MSVSTDKTDSDREAEDVEEPKESNEPEESEDAAAEPEAQGDDDSVAGGDDEQRTARDWRRHVLRGAVVAAFVVVLAAAGYLGWQLWQERQVAQAGQDARQAATDYAQVLTSIDSAKVDENFDAVLDGATGEFKDMYSQSSEQLRQLLIDNKASAHGVVLESAVQSATKDKAVILLFVDQSVTNTNVPDPRIDRSRIKMTMEHVDGRWRASKVELP